MSSAQRTDEQHNSINRNFDLQPLIAPSHFSLPITGQRPPFHSQEHHLISIPLRDRNVRKITIVQIIKNIFSNNGETLQEQSTKACQRAAAIKAFSMFCIALEIFVAVGGSLGCTYEMKTNDSFGLVLSIFLLGCVINAVVVVGGGIYLEEKRGKELQLSQMRENFEEIDPEEFIGFIDAEMSEFGNLQQEIQASIHADPRKFLEILYQICQIFMTWKKIEQNNQTIISYARLNERILPKATDLNEEVIQDLQHLAQQRTKDEQHHIKNLKQKIVKEKKVLATLLGCNSLAEDPLGESVQTFTE